MSDQPSMSAMPSVTAASDASTSLASPSSSAGMASGLAAPTKVSSPTLSPSPSVSVTHDGTPASQHEGPAPTTSSAPAASILASTGLTPDQVSEEFKKSGYLDQLRRQMYDAFLTPKAPQTDAVPAANISGDTSAADLSSISANGLTSAASVTGSSSVSEAKAAVAEATVSPNTPAIASVNPQNPTKTAKEESKVATPDLGSKESFLSFLSPLLRAQVEKEHDRLRFQDSRGQLDNLLKFLESEPVSLSHLTDAASNDDGEATVYELLTAHIVKDDVEATQPKSGSKAMLSKQGRFGKEANRRIQELISELRNPGDKAGEEDEEDADEDDDEEGNRNNDETSRSKEQNYSSGATSTSMHEDSQGHTPKDMGKS